MTAANPIPKRKSHALVIDGVVVAVGNSKEMQRERKKKGGRVWVIRDAAIGDKVKNPKKKKRKLTALQKRVLKRGREKLKAIREGEGRRLGYPKGYKRNAGPKRKRNTLGLSDADLWLRVNNLQKLLLAPPFTTKKEFFAESKKAQLDYYRWLYSQAGYHADILELQTPKRKRKRNSPAPRKVIRAAHRFKKKKNPRRKSRLPAHQYKGFVIAAIHKGRTVYWNGKGYSPTVWGTHRNAATVSTMKTGQYVAKKSGRKAVVAGAMEPQDAIGEALRRKF